MATAPQQPNLQKKTDMPVYNAPSANVRRVETPGFLFDKTNYLWMAAGIVLIVLGFALMAGGKSKDPHVFNYDEIYSTRRITIAPILILLGFIVEAYAIMRKPVEEVVVVVEEKKVI